MISFFTSIDELLLQVYFMYEKSPKKCSELEVIVDELKACLSCLPQLGHSVHVELGSYQVKLLLWVG
jgi:hypothetical protein